MEEPSWKQLKLALERPYKDDDGEQIPVLLDISPEGQHIYEQKESSTKTLGENLRRIFIERGVDFFDRTKGHESEERPASVEDEESSDTSEHPNEATSMAQTMTVEELFKMRTEIIPQLFTSLGEVSLARDLLASLLSSSQPQAENLPTNLSAAVVSKPPPIISVQAFNAQLTIGSKDEALRKAAHVFKTAADRMDRGRIKGEKYWVDALKVRKGNWGLIPAPLPFGAATGKGADKTSKDFLISYGLEESPASLRRQAVARMANNDTAENGLVFVHRQKTRLRVSITVTDAQGIPVTSQNSSNKHDLTSLEGALRVAQQEVVEQEIFSLLVQEAGNLPTASARVSERLLVIDAAQGTELKVELVRHSIPIYLLNQISTEKCNLMYSALHVLLLRRHGYLKSQRLGTAGVIHSTMEQLRPPPILQPIIDLLQYQVFCERIKSEIDKMVAALSAAGIPSSIRFDPVGETGLQLVQFFDSSAGKSIGGEAVLRIDNRHTIRLTFLSPSSLTAHLSQATLTISSIPQLCQLLTDEVERNFRVTFGKDFTINCSAFQLHKETSKQGQLGTYSPEQRTLSLLSWIERIISTAPASSS
ncbi:hypothetical protein DXG03_000365 [Asterophora parasitica]|uniref:Mediator of RNA polymerase II transcription subunit 17 n=1 Tax=Asterophora parasitica TaxID=117018 RepID=A0A9P7KED1_9AGAR|nr:hypothetical protein DXG03_000365 [Asterophora parasitica]